MLYFFYFILLFIAEIVYLRLAKRYNITNHSNHRSSHTGSTIRGGGIIFLIAAILVLTSYTIYILPILSIFIIGIISFLDDLYALSSRLRISFHLIAVLLLFYWTPFNNHPFYFFILLGILVIGIINAYNFMDGINGMTGLYSLVVFAGLQYVNLFKTEFIAADMIWLPMIACGVFLYFNFRKKAKCFAGDVGSITIALWIIILLFKLIFISQNWVYLLFLAVYGVDSVLTIVHRLILKQNIFKAHRLHFYQLLANEKKIPHLLISSGYALTQLVIILIVVLHIHLPFIRLFLICIIPLLFVYMLLKPRLR